MFSLFPYEKSRDDDSYSIPTLMYIYNRNKSIMHFPSCWCYIFIIGRPSHALLINWHIDRIVMTDRHQDINFLTTMMNNLSLEETSTGVDVS